jgi:hypothetical protein
MDVKNYMRIFEHRKFGTVLAQARDDAFHLLLDGNGTQLMLLPLLNPQVGIDIRAQDDFAFRQCAKMGYNQAILVLLGFDVHAHDDKALM